MLNELEFKSALERLFYRVFRDTGGSRRVANFLLAWENSRRFGGFDIADVWGLDPQYTKDVIDVFKYMSRGAMYFDNYGFTPHLRKIIILWRRDILDDDTAYCLSALRWKFL